MSTILEAYVAGKGFPGELVIDAHTHVARGRRYGLGGRIEESAEQAMVKMDAVGIDACCVMGSVYLLEGDYQDGNNDLLWLHKHYPDRFICFASINAHDTPANVLSELQRMYDAGIRGIKLHNTYQNYPSDGPTLLEVYRFAAERGLVVLSHSWGDLTVTERIAESFPGMTMIMGHHSDRADSLLSRFPNLYLCTWAFVRPRQIERAIKRLGPDKLVYGSDALINPYPAGLGPVVFARITDTERRSILGLNIASILDRAGYLHDTLRSKWMRVKKAL